MKNISKENITKTALSLFEKHGYDHVTIQDICDACDITKPTFYNYIDAKESLILDVYDKTINELLNTAYLLIEIESSYEQFLFIFSKLIHDTKQFHADLISQLFIANFKENKGSFAMREPLTRLCYTIIKQAQEKKEIINHSDASQLYEGIAHMFTGYCVTWCMNQGENDIEADFYKSVEDIFIVREDLRGLYKKYLMTK